MSQQSSVVITAIASIIFPCRNESTTIRGCLEEVRQKLPDWEILVVDNGCTDDSGRIAAEAGARVVVESNPGYGAALKCGLAAADGEWLLYADADGTYCLEHCAEILAVAMEAEADLVIASRYGLIAPGGPAAARRGIQPGAMPWTHRCVGTPLLTWLINRLFGTRLSDCNSGFRCVRKTAYEQWNLRCNGMEFASEMIIKAAKAGAKIIEIPSGLRPSPAGRRPHLRTWRDGMRHLLFILSERPRLFEVCGLAMAGTATALQAVAVVTGPTRVLGVSVFDVHTNALLILGAVLGVNLWTLSMAMMKPAGEEPLRMTRRPWPKNSNKSSPHLTCGPITVAARCTAISPRHAWRAVSKPSVSVPWKRIACLTPRCPKGFKAVVWSGWPPAFAICDSGKILR